MLKENGYNGNEYVDYILEENQINIDDMNNMINFINNHSNVYLYVKNGTCYVSIWDVTILEEANLEVLFNNAPKAAFMVGCALHNGYESFGHIFVTTNSTEIRLNAPSGLAGKSGYCSFSYPVAES